MYWDACLAILLVANLVLIPIDVAFFSNLNDPYWMAFHLGSDFIFFMDIVFNFRTGAKDIYFILNKERNKQT